MLLQYGWHLEQIRRTLRLLFMGVTDSFAAGVGRLLK
jgi:hypothetical protein